MDTPFPVAGQPKSQSLTGAAPIPADLIKDSDSAAFMKDVIEMSMKVPVIVDFWATWCGPCKTLGPQLERAVKDAQGAVRLVKIDVDHNQDLAGQMRIQSIPAVYAFKGGRPVDGFVGAVPESQIKAFVKRLIGDAPTAEDGVNEALAEAKQSFEDGDLETAGAIYQQIHQEIPDNAPAAAGLARVLIEMGQVDHAKALLDGLAPEMLKKPEIVAVKTSLDLAAQAQDLGPAQELAAKVEKDPNDHQSRFDLAMAYFGAGKREEAVDELLELFRRNRTWNEDGARKQLVKFFEAFGPTDPLTVASRKRLSSLMFS
jgi:putative thioredoxin